MRDHTGPTRVFNAEIRRALWRLEQERLARRQKFRRVKKPRRRRKRGRAIGLRRR